MNPCDRGLERTTSGVRPALAIPGSPAGGRDFLVEQDFSAMVLRGIARDLGELPATCCGLAAG
jgi:hypothetical protein